MPITPFQRRVLNLLAQFRSPESHVAGGIAINQSDESPRFSDDIDIFHDSQEKALHAAEADEKILQSNRFSVDWVTKVPGFCRATISYGSDTLKLDWVFDTAFRFYPVIPDADLGYRLHPLDVAINKVLAAGSRREPRDFIDVLFIHTTFLHLGALIWAAPGKDPGFSPESLLEHLDRNKAISPDEYNVLQLARPLDPQVVRQTWLRAKEESEKLIESLESEEIGCIFLDPKTGKIIAPIKENLGLYRRHFGSVKGAWPRLVEE